MSANDELKRIQFIIFYTTGPVFFIVFSGKHAIAGHILCNCDKKLVFLEIRNQRYRTISECALPY